MAPKQKEYGGRGSGVDGEVDWEDPGPNRACKPSVMKSPREGGRRPYLAFEIYPTTDLRESVAL